MFFKLGDLCCVMPDDTVIRIYCSHSDGHDEYLFGGQSLRSYRKELARLWERKVLWVRLDDEPELLEVYVDDGGNETEESTPV